MSDKMLESIKDFAELQAFSNAQNKTIIELNKRLREREEETKHLKKLLEGSVPLIKEKKEGQFESNDQEYICRTEINKLRDISGDRELTLEEAKRFDIYCKILKDLTNAPKTIEIKSKNLSDEQLLALVIDEEK